MINLYKYIQKKDQKFLEKIEELHHNWILLEKVVSNNSNELLDIYQQFCNEEVLCLKDGIFIKQKYIDTIYQFIINHADEFNGVLADHFNIKIDNFIHEIQRNLYSKISRMSKIEKQKGSLQEENILENIECAFKSAFYMHFRFLYNYKDEFHISKEFSSAIFYFIREYCYASMFRYNKDGKFNVPYGGISYNRKDFKKKIEYIQSQEIIEYMKNTKIYNLDFEEFCDKIDLCENDFMFLDPPYDTEFSAYAGNEFDKDDQIRLANYLRNTRAKFMLVIKNTDFIYNLYDKEGFHIQSFDKRYLVSFRNRNDKEAEHLIITNYEIN